MNARGLQSCTRQQRAFKHAFDLTERVEQSLHTMGRAHNNSPPPLYAQNVSESIEYELATNPKIRQGLSLDPDGPPSSCVPAPVTQFGRP